MEALIIDAQNNPDNYTGASLTEKFRELLDGYEVPKDLKHRFTLVERFIGIRGMAVKKSANEDFIKLNENLTFDDFIRGNYRT